jgi:hypothetical protein
MGIQQYPAAAPVAPRSHKYLELGVAVFITSALVYFVMTQEIRRLEDELNTSSIRTHRLTADLAALQKRCSPGAAPAGLESSITDLPIAARAVAPPPVTHATPRGSASLASESAPAPNLQGGPVIPDAPPPMHDWLGGERFMAGNQRVKPFVEHGEWPVSDKVTRPMDHHSYESIYEKYLGIFKYAEEYRGMEIKMLEVGMGPKGSAKGYRLYKEFLPQLHYVGFEYQNQRQNIERQSVLSESEREWLLAHTYWGDQGNADDRRAVTEKFGPFDIIVDDGSHNTVHQIGTIEDMFINSLKPGGVYIVEDIETSFLTDYNGGVRNQEERSTFVTLVQDLLTSLCFNYWDHPSFNKCVRLDSGMQQFAPTRNWRFRPDLTEWIQTIDCDREVCAFRKRKTKLERRRKQRDVAC